MIRVKWVCSETRRGIYLPVRFQNNINANPAKIDFHFGSWQKNLRYVLIIRFQMTSLD